MTTAQQRKSKAKKQTVIFGIMSAALYYGVYAYADPMTKLFAKGGVYTLAPIATVFLFSYVHGTFTGSIWTALGIEASSTAGKKVEKAAPKRTDSRNRSTVSA